MNIYGLLDLSFHFSFNSGSNQLKLTGVSSFKFKFSEECLIPILLLSLHTSSCHGWLTQIWVFAHPGLINHVLSGILGLPVSVRGTSNVEVSCTTLKTKLWMPNLQGEFCNSCSIPGSPSCSRCTHTCLQTAPSIQNVFQETGAGCTSLHPQGAPKYLFCACNS